MSALPQRKILEIHLLPKNGKYKLVEKYKKDQTISPKSLPKIKLKVSDIF
ncbi:MAG: hypothetical protein ACR2MD_07720 [Aridibacter sp.]|jgi:Uma2 family endonuclease